MKLFVLFCFLFMPLNAVAATFCMAGAGMSVQCLYEDVRSCRANSNPPNTSCVVNPDAYLSYVGGGRYCTLGSERIAQCLYVDRNQCNVQAARTASICIDRQGMADDSDPYKYDNRIQN